MEVASALAKKVRLSGLPAEQATAALVALDQFIPVQVATEPLIEPAMALSQTLNHALFDCLYLALAIQRGGVVVTSDLKFLAAVRRTRYDQYVGSPSDLVGAGAE